MKNMARFTTIFPLLLTLVVTVPALAQTPASPSVPNTPPNTTFKIQRQSGTCPSTVGLWTSFRYYEGGGEHTVIANTSAIAGPAQLVSSSSDKVAVFRAPLQRAYASCVGQARSAEDDFSFYRFQFGSGNVTFRVQLPADTPSNPSEISYKSVVSNRPAVRWAIAD